MAKGTPTGTDQITVFSFLQSGVGLWSDPDLAEVQIAMNLLIGEINRQPFGPAAGALWSELIRLFLSQTVRAGDEGRGAIAPVAARTVGDLMTRDPWTARPDQTLSELVDQVFLCHAATFAPVVETGRLLGYVDLQMVRGIDRENWASTTVDDLVESVGSNNTVSPDLQGKNLLARIARTGKRKFLVASDNALVGVVTLSDLISGPGPRSRLRQTPFGHG